MCLVSCTTNKNNINPWTTIVKQIVTNGMGNDYKRYSSKKLEESIKNIGGTVDESMPYMDNYGKDVIKYNLK